MKLADWMQARFQTNKMFAEKLAKELKVKRFSPRTVERWRQGKSVPRYNLMDAISNVTGGEVTAGDFVSRETNGAAA